MELSKIELARKIKKVLDLYDERTRKLLLLWGEQRQTAKDIHYAQLTTCFDEVFENTAIGEVLGFCSDIDKLRKWVKLTLL